MGTIARLQPMRRERKSFDRTNKKENQVMRIASFFETHTRSNGEKFCTLTDSSPEWLQDGIRAAHSGDMPSDWIYAECRAACEAIDRGDLSTEDEAYSYADGRVDVYTRDLYQWAADMCLGYVFANATEEAADVIGDESTTEKRISMVQYCAIRSIASAMLASVPEEAIGVTP
jgi:hypothetical protein